jgi:hypothetical protein
MRKAIAILLILFYIISSSGVAIKAHYCCGKLKSLNLVLNSNEDRECKKRCCSDRLAFYKVDDTERASSEVTFSAANSVCASIDPPPSRDINIEICAFRI